MSRSRARQIHCETAVPCVVQCVECNTSVLKHKWQARWQPSPSPRSSFRACASSRPWCASIQSRVESTVHRRSRANFRNLVSPLIATQSRESCKNAESVRNMYESTVQQLRRVRTHMYLRQSLLSVTSPQTDQTRSGCATSPTFQLTRDSSTSQA